MAYNKLTDAQDERLALLAEECAEVIQVVGKILRHGYTEGHPNGDTTNKQDLEKELGQVAYVIHEMIGKGDLDEMAISFGRLNKEVSVKQYLHHQDEDQYLEDYQVRGSNWKPNQEQEVKAGDSISPT